MILRHEAYATGSVGVVRVPSVLFVVLYPNLLLATKRATKRPASSFKHLRVVRRQHVCDIQYSLYPCTHLRVLPVIQLRADRRVCSQESSGSYRPCNAVTWGLSFETRGQCWSSQCECDNIGWVRPGLTIPAPVTRRCERIQCTVYGRVNACCLRLRLL